LEEEFPRKRFYRIGEVSRLTGVAPHVLRYWESEGKVLRPNRRRSRQRLYRLLDIELIMEIKRLVEEEKLTLPAVRHKLRQHPWSPPHPASPAVPPFTPEILEGLKTIRQELLELRALVSEGGGGLEEEEEF